jgi:hypothetical protein
MNFKIYLLAILFSTYGLLSIAGSVIKDPLVVQNILKNGILNADYIFEGEVLSTESYWNSTQDYIYTSNLIKVIRMWENKNGEVLQFEEEQIVEVITYGGRVGETSLIISHNKSFVLGEKGMFLCKNTTLPTNPGSSIPANYQFELYDGIFCEYDDSKYYLSASFSSINFECIEELYELIDPNYITNCLNVYPNGALQTIKYGEFLQMTNNTNNSTSAGYGKLTYTIENARTTNFNGIPKFEFDVFIKSNNNYYLEQGLVRIGYNDLAFGTNPINDITVLRGGDVLYSNTHYVNPVVGQISNNEIAIGVVSYPGATKRTLLQANLPMQIFHVKMKIIDCNELPGISFVNHNIMKMDNKYCLNANGYLYKRWINYDFSDNENMDLCQMDIYSISPLNVNAGTADITGNSQNAVTSGGDIVTVYGVFLGNIGTIKMKNTDHKGPATVTLDPYDIISWTDNEVKFRVPASVPINYSSSGQLVIPGSGQITITNGTTGDVKTSAQSLVVEYSRRNILRSNINAKSKLFLVGPDQVLSEDGVTLDKGYSFIVHPNLISNTTAMDCIQKAIDDWVCATQVRFQIDATSVPHGAIKDSISIIKYGTTTNSLAYAQTSTWTYSCKETGIDGLPVDYVTDIDIVVNNNPSNINMTFYDKTGTQDQPANQYDFYSIILHELGHAHNLQHVNQKDDLMWDEAYKSSVNTPYWQRHIYFNLANINGGTDVVNESVQINYSSLNCYYSVYPMVTLPKSNCSVPTSIKRIQKSDYLSEVKLYPNPVDNLTQISFELGANSQVSFEVYSIFGVQMFQSNIKTFNAGLNNLDWDASGLKPGMYIGVLKINGSELPIQIVKH